MGQQKLNGEIDKLLEEVEKGIPRKSGQVLRASERSRLTIDDILTKYADSSGRIPRGKQTAVVRDLQRVENEIYRNIRDELQLALSDAATQTSTGLSLAIMSALDVATLLTVAGINGTAAQVGAETATVLFELLTGRSRDRFKETIERTPFQRKDDDGKRLNDRLRDIARTIRQEVSSTLRKSIRNGEVTSQMSGNVRKSFRKLAWRLKLIVETEILYVMRNGIATFAEYSGIAEGLKIVDYPHGAPGEHERHMCYKYAHQDEHGMGEGVYPVGTRKIRHPHPRCRSTLHLVLVDRLA